jgi:2-phospho-L-lactate guanylyltransferase
LMARIALIIPVKGGDPKSRLGSILDLGKRKRLQLAMLEDTIRAVSNSKLLSDTYVVTSDTQASVLATRFGARSIMEDSDYGVNEAVGRAMNSLDDYEAWMILPADLPLLTSKDLSIPASLLDRGATTVISPSDEFNGTNLLLMSREGRINLHYDDDSFNKHLREALIRNLRVALYYSEGVAFDLDSQDDLHTFLKARIDGATMRMLWQELRGHFGD